MNMNDSLENTAAENQSTEKPVIETPVEGESTAKKKKVSLSDFKVKSFVTNVKVEQMQFLKTAGG